jgi:hypothetical protein
LTCNHGLAVRFCQGAPILCNGGREAQCTGLQILKTACSNHARCSINIGMLVDWHRFQYHATVPWPVFDHCQVDWIQGITVVESWLKDRVGPRYAVWAYDDCNILNNIGIAFKWDQDRTLFVLAWGN